MSKKKKRPIKISMGAPEWMVTFGDMMSLLLCFFILLQMFSELKRDHEYQRVITAVKEAFGYSGGVGTLPIDDPPLRSIIEQLEQLSQKQRDTTKMSESDQDSIEGPNMRVTKIREGLVFSIGGPSTFDPESAEVKEASKPNIKKIARLIQGRTNKIVIRGHAANKYLSENSEWDDLYRLSYERARNVLKQLIEFGIEEGNCRIEAVGRWEPVKSREVGYETTEENRRVEIIMTETLIDEASSNSAFTDNDGVQGG